MSTHQSKITLIICTYNRADYLDNTLRSLLQHKLSKLPVELLIIDNNSSDETRDIVQQYQKSASGNPNPIRYVYEPNQGLSYARNRGIQEAKSPYVVFLDDDIRVTDTLIPAWLSFFENYPKAQAAGGKIHVQFDDPRPQWLSRFLLPLLGHHDLGHKLKTYPSTKYPFGGNMGFRSAVFNQVDAFHTGLGRKGGMLKASEEKDLFQRLREKDIELYFIPDAMIYHRVNKRRLTKAYIKEQALGLGQSIALVIKDKPCEKLKKGVNETGKLGISLVLALLYLLSFQPSKAKMLLQFRYWIAEGYFNYEGN